MDAQALLQSGDLAGARAALANSLRQNPGDALARQFFWQLIALHGEWEKAGTQLQALSTAEPKAMMLASVYNQALAAMLMREAVWSGKERPQSVVGTEPWVEGLLDALHAAAVVAPDTEQRIAAALDAAPASTGNLNGEAFEWIADADGRFGPMLEVIVGDQYGFLPFAAIRRIKSKGPEDLRDLVWIAADIELRSGQTSAAMLPVTYPGTGRSGQPALMLARSTDWQDLGGVECGLGQHLLTTDGPECGVLELRELVID
jgi:type VI secretion system protein ImpE